METECIHLRAHVIWLDLSRHDCTNGVETECIHLQPSQGSRAEPRLGHNQRNMIFKLLDVLFMDELAVCIDSLGDAG